MKIAFNCGHLNFRGTTVALYDYALYNQTILGNESIILTYARAEMDALSKFNRKFRVFTYDEGEDIDTIIERENVHALYTLKEGKKSDLFLSKKVPNLVHCIFSNFEPHGDVYAYVSKWLAESVTKGKYPYVPHIVTLPKIVTDLREELGIPKDAIVFGRHGGGTEFCIRFARRVVKRIARERKDVYFLFMNTNRFNKRWPNKNLKNIIYLPPTTDLEYKTRFINTCDAMIHAREEGETFGLSICEFLHQGRPVFAWNGGRDRHHIDLLKNAGTLYDTEKDLYKKLNSVKRRTPDGKFKKLVEQFAPEQVMKIFQEVFLNPIIK